MSDLYSVYEIRCIINNKVYIGQTKSIDIRIANHKYHLKKGDHFNIYLQSDFNKYKFYGFQFLVLKRCSSREEAKQLEDYYIDINGGIESDMVYNQQNNMKHNSLYNNKITMSAKNNPNYGNRGKSMSIDTKIKLSEVKKLQWRTGVYTKNNLISKGPLSVEHKQKISNKLKNRRLSEEHKQKISKSLTGKKFTDEHRLNISKAKVGKSSNLKGTNRTLETKQKISDNAKNNPNYGMRGKKLSDEARNKISISNRNRGRKYNEEFVQIVRNLRNCGMTCRQLSIKYNINYSVMNRLLNHGTAHPR